MADWPYSTARWQRLRKVKLSAKPLCEDCERTGRITPASHVDHVKAISNGGAAFPAVEGLRSLCPSCHSAKTARGKEAGAVRSTKPRRGCDVHGNPLDAEHPWQGKSLRAGAVGPSAVPQNQLVPERNLSSRGQGGGSPSLGGSRKPCSGGAASPRSSNTAAPLPSAPSSAATGSTPPSYRNPNTRHSPPPLPAHSHSDHEGCDSPSGQENRAGTCRKGKTDGR